MRNIILAFILLLFSCKSTAESGLIINSSMPLMTISAYEVRGIFSGKIRHWKNGSNVHLYILPLDSLATRLFLLENVGMSSTQFQDIISMNESVGKQNLYILKLTEDDVLHSIQVDATGIGYVKDINNLVDGVKKVKVLQ
jgi:hypothetical protein